ncbi:MAG: hypothetical protein MUP14_01925 [Dehalococcoidia bacterium]|nr:hypothetical protein [Dehalococcoidia bacterium]
MAAGDLSVNFKRHCERCPYYKGCPWVSVIDAYFERVEQVLELYVPRQAGVDCQTWVYPTECQSVREDIARKGPPTPKQADAAFLANLKTMAAEAEAQLRRATAGRGKGPQKGT